MSVTYTEAAVRDRTKTVTRRKGWVHLSAGDRITLCQKVMGRRKGEPLVRIVEVEVVSVRREPLRQLLDQPAYGRAETRLEGMGTCDPAAMDPQVFIERYFLTAQKMRPDEEITRIEWRYLEPDDRERLDHGLTTCTPVGPGRSWSP